MFVEDGGMFLSYMHIISQSVSHLPLSVWEVRSFFRLVNLIFRLLSPSTEEMNFGKSLIVPSVQELARDPVTKIPLRYVRHLEESESGFPSDASLPHQSVPVIKLQSLLTGTSVDSELEKLHLACKDWGFFQIIEAYSQELKNLAMTLLTQMAKALKMDNEEMIGLFSDGVQSMRMNYYAPCPEPDKAIGFTPHSDVDALTILFQVNEIEGLQIRKHGKWISVKPKKDAFIVNVGDIMEIISNGVYRSVEHRATVNRNHERLSIATFYSSNMNSLLGPAKSLIGPQNPAVFKSVPLESYFKEFFAQKLNGKSYLDLMKIQRKEHES